MGKAHTGMQSGPATRGGVMNTGGHLPVEHVGYVAGWGGGGESIWEGPRQEAGVAVHQERDDGLVEVKVPARDLNGGMGVALEEGGERHALRGRRPGCDRRNAPTATLADFRCRSNVEGGGGRATIEVAPREIPEKGRGGRGVDLLAAGDGGVADAEELLVVGREQPRVLLPDPRCGASARPPDGGTEVLGFALTHQSG